MDTLRSIGWAIAFVPLLITTASAVDRAALDRAVAGNSFSRESIGSIYIAYEALWTGEKAADTIRGEYWRKGEWCRSEHSDPAAPGKTWVHACDGQLVKSLVYSPIGDKMVQTGNIQTAGRRIGKVDPWNRALMTVNFSTQGTFTLKDAVDRGTKIDSVTATDDVVVVRFALDNGFIEVRLDPKRNYMVSSTTGWGPGIPNARGEQRVVRARMIAPGVFFPEEVEDVSHANGAATVYSRIRFTTIRVNAPIPENKVTFAFPRGILLAHRPRGESYKSDEQGNPLNPAAVSRTSPPPEPVVPAEPLLETQEEPQPRSRWLLPIGIGFVVLALAIVGFRRLRAGRS